MTDRIPIHRSIRWRLWILFATAAVLTGALSAAGFLKLSRTVELAQETDHAAEAHDAGSQVQRAVTSLESDLNAYLVLRSPTSRQAVEYDLEAIDSALALLTPHVGHDTELAAHIAPIVRRSESLISETQQLLDVAATDAPNLNRRVAATYSALDIVRDSYEAYSDLSLSYVGEAAHMQEENASEVMAHISLGIFFAAFLLLASIMVGNRVLGSVAKVRDSAVSIASGDLDQKIEVTGADEIGHLATAFNSMTQQLRESIETLERRVDERTAELNTINDRLHDEVAERRATEQAAQAQATELEATLQELGSTHTQLLQAQKLEAIGGLAAGVAHEVNTPIQFVGDNVRFLKDSFAQVIELANTFSAAIAEANGQMAPEIKDTLARALATADVGFLAEEVPDALDETLHGVDRIAEIVRALKEFSHPGGQERRSVDLNHVVTNTVAISKNEWKYVADLDVRLCGDSEPIEAQSGPLGQVLLVLIVNAAQAIEGAVEGTAEKGLITVSTRQTKDWAILEVSDTGCGIPEEHRDKIFDHFFTTKDVGKGSGQGLSIAHSIVVQKHGGEIECESEVGRGTKFIVRLPRNADVTPELEDANVGSA